MDEIRLIAGFKLQQFAVDLLSDIELRACRCRTSQSLEGDLTVGRLLECLFIEAYGLRRVFELHLLTRREQHKSECR